MSLPDFSTFPKFLTHDEIAIERERKVMVETIHTGKGDRFYQRWMDGDESRQTGRTTRQMTDAPKGAIYVWPHQNSINYPKSIARQIGRDDLEIIFPEQLTRDRMRSRAGVYIVIDHAVHRISEEGLRALEYAEKTCRP